MKKVSSDVWQFFDRLEENKRCVAVLCKLCETEYKYFGNTTNLRVHLIKKHPIQWELRQSTWDGRKSLEESRVDIIENSEMESNTVREDSEATLNLVRQMHEHTASDEEWLEEDFQTVEMYEPKKVKNLTYRKIKREVVTPPRRHSAKFIVHGSPKPKHSVQDESSTKDEYSVFGEYIANKLRKFKAPKTRGNIQQLLTTILWQAEYGLYDNADVVKRVVLASVQEMNIQQDAISDPIQYHQEENEASKDSV